MDMKGRIMGNSCKFPRRVAGSATHGLSLATSFDIAVCRDQLQSSAGSEGMLIRQSERGSKRLNP
jgi:hypothetical protein